MTDPASKGQLADEARVLANPVHDAPTLTHSAAVTPSPTAHSLRGGDQDRHQGEARFVVVVRGSKQRKHSRWPYVKVHGVCYSSPELVTRFDLIGQRFLLRIRSSASGIDVRLEKGQKVYDLQLFDRRPGQPPPLTLGWAIAHGFRGEKNFVPLAKRRGAGLRRRWVEAAYFRPS